jgi:hypothetical protein
VPRSKDKWSYNFTPQYAFMAWGSVEAQGQLYLYFIFTEFNKNSKVPFAYLKSDIYKAFVFMLFDYYFSMQHTGYLL